jgi:hypothetical protein
MDKTETIQRPFKRKQPEASNDYTTAYNIVQGLTETGATNVATYDNAIRFRKYLYDLGIKNNKTFRTQKLSKNRMKIILF